MGKKNGTVATMKLIENLHDEAMGYMQEMYGERARVEIQRNKFNVCLDELMEERAKVLSLSQEIGEANSRIRELEDHETVADTGDNDTDTPDS